MTTQAATSSPPEQQQPTDYDIDQQVRDLLASRKGEWESIAERSGVVSYSWISKFMNDHIPGSKVDTLRALRAWLRANPSPEPPAA